jgi:hypothetical protein
MTLAWVLALLSVLAVIVIAVSSAALPRIIATLVVVFGPGFAWVPMLNVRDRALEWLLILVTSITAVIIVAQVVTYASGFSWRPCEFSLLGVTLLGLIVQSVLVPALAGDNG